MISWGDNIVITEPAPALVRPARYLAPKPIAEESPEILLLIATFAVFLIAVIGGGSVGELAVLFLGKGARLPVWVISDLALATCVTVSYYLVARHGLRFPDSQRHHMTLAKAGNVAFTCLPEPRRSETAERLHVMNAASRLLLIDPDDQDARTVLEEESRHLQHQTLTLGAVATAATSSGP
ncbi:hypothetical protein ACWGI1_00325 [Streptomyces sp. NPDC054835]|uniref:hypothetical protein n=1 Tax=Streptomyces exfoliatus TaxID=1905 RepID=UPI0004677114|nr:hypothetical protein [Streptomyces exfoliatus]